MQALLATDPAATQRIATTLAPIGAEVRYRADEIGYLRVEVPTGKVGELAKLPGVQALEVSENIRVEPPERGGGPLTQGVGTPKPQPAPNVSTPRVNPYLPTGRDRHRLLGGQRLKVHTTQAEIVAEGWTNTKHHESLEHVSPVNPGEQDTFSWKLQPEDYVFKAGHGIGLIIAASDCGAMPEIEYGKRGTPNARIDVELGTSSIGLPIAPR